MHQSQASSKSQCESLRDLLGEEREEDADDINVDKEAAAEAIRLGVCLQLASEGGTGTVKMFALQNTVQFLLETLAQHYPSMLSCGTDGKINNNDNDDIGDDAGFTGTSADFLPMIRVLTTGLLTAIQIIELLLHLPSDKTSGNKEEQKEKAALKSAIARADMSHNFGHNQGDNKRRKSNQKKNKSNSNTAPLPNVGQQSVSKKLQMECLSLLVMIVKANPFQRNFSTNCSSPTSALAQVTCEQNSAPTATNINVGEVVQGKDKECARAEMLTRSLMRSLRSIELSFLEPLHSLLTRLTTRMMDEENTRGVTASAFGYLETLLLSTICGGGDPCTILVSA